jgi:uncharacterized RDD family membrane protein YckC
MPDLSRARAPGLPRRLATMTYDLMLLFGVLVIASLVVTLPVQSLTGVDLTAGLPRFVFQVYLLAVIVLYYVYFWTGGRQTLGMRAWRTLVLRDDGEPMRVADGLRRLAFAAVTLAPAGLGLWWVLFDRDGLAWYDRLSRTRPVLTVKPGRARVAADGGA